MIKRYYMPIAHTTRFGILEATWGTMNYDRRRAHTHTHAFVRMKSEHKTALEKTTHKTATNIENIADGWTEHGRKKMKNERKNWKCSENSKTVNYIGINVMLERTYWKYREERKSERQRWRECNWSTLSSKKNNKFCAWFLGSYRHRFVDVEWIFKALPYCSWWSNKKKGWCCCCRCCCSCCMQQTINFRC